MKSFLKAASLSVFHYCKLHPSLCVFKAFGVCLFIITSYFAERSQKRVQKDRLDVCEQCVLFDKNLKTCGTPGRMIEMPGGKEPFGCWCYMPVKVRLIHVNCWMWEKTNGAKGWPFWLNGKELKTEK